MMSSVLLQKGLPLLTSTSQNSYAPVAKWIFGTAGMVFGMIHVGGVTRLTQSGLSMTTWHPLGSLPPLSSEEWQSEFDRYKQFPEWTQRKSMTLGEFKHIFWWEYGHRMMGRCVGLVFCLPWLYFTARGRIPNGYQPRMFTLCAMGGMQGVVGWWMVKSGLGDDRRQEKSEIRVKPVRLATHLTMAFATYGALCWTGWDIFALGHDDNALKKQISKMSRDALTHASRLRAASIALTGLTAVTVVSGALVAGNDAGRAYSTWPKMGDHWIPPEVYGGNKTLDRKITEDTATVQFNHRILGMTTAATALGILALAKPNVMTPQARNGIYAVGLAATGQMTLGIYTLLNYVPISLAAVHQLGGVVVFTSGLYLVHSLRYVRPALLRTVKHIVTK
mmetsp:Transcript_18274/g.26234  ORF Transcript_18274/g.26234 Transcript_18274/m.26234 type:complete len:391 (-) Transcript_18274:28-1200(-)